MPASSADLMIRAFEARTIIPAFNIAHLSMLAPVVAALCETNAFGLVQVARPDWEKFGAGSMEEVRDEYERHKDDAHTGLHLDHVPVIDEDDLPVDYMPIIEQALALGYGSVMVDGSRLSLEENIAATARVVEVSHAAGVPVEAELGAVLGHEAGPLPPYEELFRSGQGFTDPDQAARFVQESGVDWLSVAAGSVHGAISGAAKDRKKVAARLNIEHLDRIREVTGVPLVLHGGSGIRKESVLDGVRHGIAKINIGTAIRQAYEGSIGESVEAAQEAVFATSVGLIRNELEIAGSADVLDSAGG